MYQLKTSYQNVLNLHKKKQKQNKKKQLANQWRDNVLNITCSILLERFFII